MRAKDEQATDLAWKHDEIEAGITQIFRIHGTSEREFGPNDLEN